MYKGRGCGDLAVNISSTNEKPFTNMISNQPIICAHTGTHMGTHTQTPVSHIHAYDHAENMVTKILL